MPFLELSLDVTVYENLLSCMCLAKTVTIQSRIQLATVDSEVLNSEVPYSCHFLRTHWHNGGLFTSFIHTLSVCTPNRKWSCNNTSHVFLIALHPQQLLYCVLI